MASATATTAETEPAIAASENDKEESTNPSDDLLTTTWRLDPSDRFSDWKICVATMATSSASTTTTVRFLDEATSTSYHVHKCKLATGPYKSEYFCRLFSSGGRFAESQESISKIELKEESLAKAFPDLLDCVYHGNSKLGDDNAAALHELAAYFDIGRLRYEAQQYIIRMGLWSHEPSVGASNADMVSPPTPKKEDFLVWRVDPAESLSDFEVQVKSNGDVSATYHVHKVMLATGQPRSEYFGRLFGSRPRQEQLIGTSFKLDPIAARAFPAMLDYLYTPTAHHHATANNELNGDNATALHWLASKFDIPCLRDETKHYIERSLSWKSCGGFYEHAKLLGADTILAVADAYCRKHLDILPSDSRLVYAADMEFWRSIIRTGLHAGPHLSRLIQGFCSVHTEEITPHDFLELTSESSLPVIHGEAALLLMDLERRIMHPHGRSSSSEQLSNLQERCITALAKDWRSGDLSAELLYEQGTMVVVRILEETKRAAREDYDDLQSLDVAENGWCRDNYGNNPDGDY